MSGKVEAGNLRRSDVLQVAALVVMDVFALYEAFVLAYIVRASAAKPLAHHISEYGFGALVLMVAPLWILVFAVCGLYSVRMSLTRMSEVTRVIVAVGGGVMSLIVWDYLLPNEPLFPSRAVPVWAVLFGVVLVLSCRGLLRRGVRYCFAQGLGLHNVILIGAGPLAHSMAKELTVPGRGYRIAAVVEPSRDGGEFSPGVPVFRALEDAMQSVRSRHWNVDEIMQAEVDLDRVEIARMMAVANQHGINYRFVPDQFGVYAAASSATTVGGIPVLELRLTALDGWGAVGKRAFDIAGSALLLLLFSPVLLAVAVATKLSDPSGPVLYQQNRLGKNGRPIKLMKFRSMSWLYSTGPDREFKTAPEALAAMGRADLIPEFELNHKLENDPRVSALGNFLRRTSLDELPQLINAFRGDISLVGPRPITQAELDRYGERGASFLALKPGLTGLWQVSGRSQVSYAERVQMDVFYVENWSLGLDVNILFRTVRSVTARKGAY